MSSPSMQIKINDAGLKKLHATAEQFPVEAEAMVRSVLLGVGKTEVERIRANHYSSSGGNSVGVGPGRYGHVREALYAKVGAIGAGGYVRLKFQPGPRFKAFFAEAGTSRQPPRHPLRSGMEGINEATLDAALAAGIARILSKG